LAALPGAVLWQDGSDGATVLFDVALFPRVAKLMHPRRSRRLTPEHRVKLMEAGAKHRFGNGSGARREAGPCFQSTPSGPEPAPAAAAAAEALELLLRPQRVTA
jgi:hypothetical protein